MARIHKLFGTVAAVVAVMTVSSSSAQQSSACAERRMQGIRLARQINTLELHESQAKKSFVPFSELSGVVVPDGFTVQLVQSASEFVFSIKDTRSDCNLAVFSDQNYVIYTGEPLQ